MSSGEFDLKSVLALLRRQARLTGLATALVLGLAGAWLLTVAPVYEATALVLVDPNKKNLLDTNAQGPTSAAADNSRVDSEVEILKSQAVALAVVRAEGLVRDPEFGPRIGLAEKLRRGLGFAAGAQESGEALVRAVLDRFREATEIRRRGLTYLIAVSVRSEAPDRAAGLANALAGAYIRQQVEAKIAASLAARDVLEGQIEAARRAIAASDTGLDALIDSNLARIEAEGGRSDIAELRRALADLEGRRLAAEVTAAAAQAGLRAGDWAEATARLGDEALAEMQRQREELERRLGTLAGDTAEAVDLRAALARLEADQEARAGTAIGALRAEIAALDTSAREFRTRMRDTLLQGELSSEILTGVYELQQEAAIARSQHQALLSRMRDLETQAGIQVADSRVVSPALPPIEPAFPQTTTVLGAALLAGLGLGVGLAFLNEYYIGGITSANQLRDVLHSQVATAIPVTAPRAGDQLSVADNIVQAPLSPYSEAIRRLRAAIDQGLRDRAAAAQGARRGRVIMITSTIPAEGKSTTALALARAYALAGRKTLLIDGDLRKPTLHRQLGLAPESGFIDFLRDPSAEDLTAAFCGRDPQTGLSLILGAGRSDIPTDPLLTSETFAILMRDAAAAFDIVVLDTPPVLPVVDARYMARHADAVVMVVRFGLTNQGDLRQAASTMQEALDPGALFLAALSHQPAAASRHRYDGYYADYEARAD